MLCKREDNLPTSFLTDCVVDELQPCYNLPECWPHSWIFIPALFNQSTNIYHYSLKNGITKKKIKIHLNIPFLCDFKLLNSSIANFSHTFTSLI